MEIYSKDKEMKKILEKFFNDYPACAFLSLKDKSIIASLNHNQLEFAEDGYAFYDYIKNGILNSKKINNEINWNHLTTFTNSNGKKDYIYPAEYFRDVLLSRYSL